MNGLFRLAIKTDLLSGERRVIDFTDYTRPACEPPDADYTKGVVYRNWSLMGAINQKGLRPQDKPAALSELSESQRALIRRGEEKFGLHIL